MSRKKMDVIIIGGGASGMMAAIAAAREGCRVCVLERMPEPGKKLLATGNGRCNFTNTEQGLACYRGTAPAFVLHALKNFGCQETIKFFEHMGVLSKDRNGYVYPRTMQASSIRNVLTAAMKELHVSVRCGIQIISVHPVSAGFEIETEDGTYTSETCILASGGKASPKSGSDGSGYLLAEKLGHRCIRPVPALTPLISDAPWLKKTAGVRAEGTVTLSSDRGMLDSDTGEIQFTDYGISGIPVFQVSRYASEALAWAEKVTAELDLLPEITEHKLIRCLEDLIDQTPMDNWQDLLSGMINRKLADAVCDILNLQESHFHMQSDSRRKKTIRGVARMLKHLSIHITGTKGFQQAQVTAGGIVTDEICSETMESKIVPHFYFAGEIMDIDGRCGGYNLQWAWSSGYCAGKSAAAAVKNINHTDRVKK